MVLLLELRNEQLWRDMHRTSSAVPPTLKTFELERAIHKQKKIFHISHPGVGRFEVKKEGDSERNKISEDHFMGLAHLI